MKEVNVLGSTTRASLSVSTSEKRDELAECDVEMQITGQRLFGTSARPVALQDTPRCEINRGRSRGRAKSLKDRTKRTDR